MRETPVVPQQMDELEERHWQLVDFFQNRRELLEAAVELAPSYDDCVLKGGVGFGEIEKRSGESPKEGFDEGGFEL